MFVCGPELWSPVRKGLEMLREPCAAWAKGTWGRTVAGPPGHSHAPGVLPTTPSASGMAGGSPERGRFSV